MGVCVTLPLIVKAAGCSGGASHTQRRIKGPLPWAPHPQLPREHPSASTAAVSDWKGTEPQLGVWWRQTWGWWGRGKHRCLWRQQESDFGGQLGTGQVTVSKDLCGRHWCLGHMALSTTPTLHPETHMHQRHPPGVTSQWVYFPLCFYRAHLEDDSMVLGRSRE